MTAPTDGLQSRPLEPVRGSREPWSVAPQNPLTNARRRRSAPSHKPSRFAAPRPLRRRRRCFGPRSASRRPPDCQRSPPSRAERARASALPARLDRPRPPPRPRRSALPLAERPERVSKVALRARPAERNTLARRFLQRRDFGRDRLLDPRVPLSRSPSARSVFPRPICVPAQSSGTRSRVRSSSADRNAATASSSRAVPLSRSPSAWSALPRLVCVAAQSSGTRSRVLSSSAARNPLACVFLQRRAKGRDRLLEPRRPVLPLAERQERTARLICIPAHSSGTRLRVNSSSAAR